MARNAERGRASRLSRAVMPARLMPAAALLAGLAALAPAQTKAEEAPHLAIELNKLEAIDEGAACRVYLVFQNTTPQAFETLRLDLVVFGTDGVIAKRLSVDAAPLPASRKMVKLFDLAGLDCTQVGEVLLNGVATCPSAQDAAPAGCAAPPVTTGSASGAVPFVR